MKILLVEDDLELSANVREWLSAERYDISECASGNEALERLKEQDYDLIILDIQLPGLNGIEVCKSYRATRGSTPILMLTGKGTVDDRVVGLDAGADDYLAKPFSLKELTARVRALLRRPAELKSNVLEVGCLKLDTSKYRISKNGIEMQLMPRDFALLEFFMRNPDKVFSADALLNRVWSDDSDASPDALRTAIKRIRKKLDDSDNEAQSFIENIPRVGYRLRIRQ